MKYFKEGDILLSDFDGVFVDSQERFLKIMNDESTLQSWIDYLNSLNWKEFLEECNEMPEATKTFIELEKLGILKGFITRIHSFDEGKEKSRFIRERGIYVPIYYVLPEQPKSMVYMPNEKTYILEDDPKNAFDWELNGGKSIIYNPRTEVKNKCLIKNLSDLLTK